MHPVSCSRVQCSSEQGAGLGVHLNSGAGRGIRDSGRGARSAERIKIDATRRVAIFSLFLSMYISVREKKFDKIPLRSIIAPMDETYYARNKEARCKYQREYYKKNKARVNRKRQIDEAVAPEKIEKRLAYNRAYYLKNRARLLKRRAERYQKIKEERERKEAEENKGVEQA